MIKCGGCRHTEVGIGQQGTENIGVDHVRCIVKLTVVANDLIEHLEVAPQNTSNLKQQHRDDGGPDGRKCDIPDFLEHIGAVDIRSLIALGINAGDGRYVNDGVVSHPFPGVEDTDDPGPNPGHRIDIDLLSAKSGDDVVQYAGLIVKDVEHKGADDHPGNEVTQEANRLGNLFENPPGEL